MTLTFNREKVMNNYRARMARGIDISLDSIAQNAARRAPVRKDKARRHLKKEEAVRVIRENFISDRTRYAATMNEFGRPLRNPVLQPVETSSVRTFQLNRHAGATVDEAAKLARSRRNVGAFTFKFVGARSGTETGNIGYDPVRGKVTAKAAVRGGNLKSKIRRTQVEIDGNRVSGSVISGAPYSVYVEGVKRGHGAPQPFMRPAIADFKGQWRNAFKSGR